MKSMTVFFDLGGTLIGTPDMGETISRKLGETWPDSNVGNLFLHAIDRWRYEIDRIPFMNIAEVMKDTLTILARKHGYRDISHQAYDICFDVYAYQSFLFPETISVLDKLAENGTEMIIASDNDMDLLEIQLSMHNLNKYFSDMCISESVKAYKPSDKFISHLEKYSRGREESCYFVGDNEFDIVSGRKLGVNSVLINRNGRGENPGADYVIHDLNGILPLLDLE